MVLGGKKGGISKLILMDPQMMEQAPRPKPQLWLLHFNVLQTQKNYWIYHVNIYYPDHCHQFYFKCNKTVTVQGWMSTLTTCTLKGWCVARNPTLYKEMDHNEEFQTQPIAHLISQLVGLCNYEQRHFLPCATHHSILPTHNCITQQVVKLSVGIIVFGKLDHIST